MPTLIRLLTSDNLQTLDYTADSMADAVQYEPQNGIYTVANTFNRYYTLKLDAHFDRMEDSARRQNIALNLDHQRVRQALRQMIDEADFGSVRFRVTVSQENPNQFILTIEPFYPPSEEMIATGVRCITAANSARHDALAKTTDWMHTRKALTDAMPEGIYDTFLLDEKGYILEGLGANFYAIIDGKLWTAGEGVLKGISQQIVFEITPNILPVHKQAPHVSQIAEFSGAFLTSSSRGIIPVVEIDGIQIGEGVPSDTTRKLRTAYQEWLNEHLEAL
jgi:branched-chain amino acid aminotransferase